MGLFGNKKEGGLMDVIRCDEKDYLIWKWSPDGIPSRKENAIRYGSSLRVKDGEVAVFVYKQSNGQMQDFIEGPFDQTIKTANFPVLTSIVGSAFGGASPFQAEIYFINLAGNVQKTFYIHKKFDITDPRFPDFPVPVSAKGTITFNIKDYKGFIKLHRMIDFDMDDFWKQIEDALGKFVKSAVLNTPYDMNVSALHVERLLDPITDAVAPRIKEALETDFGVSMKRLDLSEISLNKESDGYKALYEITAKLQTETLKAQKDINIKNLGDQQAIAAENMAEALRIQREETQRAQRLQTEMANMSAHQLDVQGDVAKTAAQSLGQLGGSGMGMGGDGMNPAGMMTGMMMGGAVGGAMSNMMGNMMQGMNQPQPPAPPASAIAQYHIAVNGQQAGPYTMEQLRQMIGAGTFTRETHVWKQGMGAWELAANVPEVASLFGCVPPPPPPAMPPAL